MDYNFLLNMRFSIVSGPIDLAKGTWIYSSIDCTEPGRFTGEACKFDGVDSSLSRVSGSEITFDVTTPFTFSFWARFNLDLDHDKDRNIICYGESLENCIYFSDNLHLHLVDNDGNMLTSDDLSSVVRTNQWNHFCFVRNEDHETSLYVNGVRRSEVSTSIGQFLFGDYNTYIGRDYNGYLDDIVLCEGAIPVSAEGTISVPNNYLATELDPSMEEDAIDWEDTDPGISKYDDIIKLTEEKRINAYDRIQELQEGLCPYVLKDTSTHLTDTYFMNGVYHVYRDHNHINITIQGVQDNYLFSRRDKQYFVTSMTDAYNEDLTPAFLLFIDNRMIPWSDIIITRSDNHLTLTVEGYNWRNYNDTNIGEIYLLAIPFKICYSETGNIDSDAQLLYHFSKDGIYGGNDIIIGAKTDKVKIYVFDHYEQFSSFLPPIDLKYKLTESNFTVFSPDGRFVRSPSIFIPLAGNMFTLRDSLGDRGYSVIICLDANNCHAEDNIVRLEGNTNFVRFIVAGKAMNGEEKTEDLYGPRPGNIPDFPIATYALPNGDDPYNYTDTSVDPNLIGLQFNFHHSFDTDYNSNINNSINYVFDYDKNKYDKIYESESPLVIVPMDIAKIIANRRNSYNMSTVTISRNIFDDREETSQSYPVVFVNGMIPEWYNHGVYTNETVSWITPEFSYADTFEVAYFRFVRNELIPLNTNESGEAAITINQNYPDQTTSFTVTNDPSLDPGSPIITKKTLNNDEANTDFLNLPDFYINKDDILIYTDKKGENVLLPIRYSLDALKGVITLEDRKYLSTNLYMGSMKQFRYKRIPINRDSSKILLPEEFKSCYNPAKFMVFVNGRLLNSSLYRVIIPKMTDSRIKEKCIYSMRTIKAGDQVDVIYYGGACLNKINYNGDLVFKAMKVYATQDNQDDFIIPLPFKGFQIPDTSYSGFILIKDSLIVEDNKYYVYEKDNVYHVKMIDWNDRVFVTGDALTFIFPYYKSDWDMEDKISDTNSMEFITRSTIVARDGTSTVTFQPDIMGDVSDTRYIYIFVDAELVNSEYYYIENANTVQFTFPLEANSEVTMIIETDRYTLSTNNVGLKYFTLHADNVGQNLYKLPYTGRPGSYMLFRNGRYFDSDAYSIDGDTLILHYNYNDITPEDELVGICSIDTSSDFNVINYYQYHIKMIDKNKIDIPNYTGTIFNKNNIILFINGELLNRNYYSITSNTIYLTEGIGEIGYDAYVIVAYKTLNSNTVQTYPSFAKTNFDRIEVKATYDGQQTFKVPNPPFATFSSDYKFILLLRGMFIPEVYYTFNEDRTEIYLENYDNIKNGDVLSFLFCTNYGFGYIEKTEYSVAMPSNKTVTLPPLFGNSLNLLSRMMVFYGSVYIDQSRYQVDNINRKVIFDDSVSYDGFNNRLVTFVFFYTGNSDTGIVGMLPETGYMFFDDKQIDRNINKNMYLMFVNGKKVLQKNILDVTNSIKKVTSDIKSRYGLEVITFSPKILEFYNRYKELHKVDQFTLTIPQSDNQRIYVLCNNILHTNTFKTERGSQYSAYAIGNKGYIAGSVTPSAGIVNSDITFNATAARQGSLVTVRIIQKDHQLISVNCNGRTYTATFQELSGANFTASIKAIDNGYTPGALNHTSGTITNGLTIEAGDPSMQQIKMTINDLYLDHQTLVTDVYEMDQEKHSIYYNAGTISMDYEAYVLFFMRAESGYDAGTKVGPFAMDTVYSINRDYDNLTVENTTGPYVVAGKIAQMPNQRIYVRTEDTEGNIHTYTSDFIAKKNVKYSITVVPDDGYEAGKIITNTNVSNGDMFGPLSVTVSPAKELPEEEKKPSGIRYVVQDTGYIQNEDPLEEGKVRIQVIVPENKNEAILVETKKNLYVNENVDVEIGSEVNIYLKSTDGAPKDTLYVANIPIKGYKTTYKITGEDKYISCYAGEYHYTEGSEEKSDE